MNAPYHPDRSFIERAERTMTLLMVAKIRAAEREGLCRIRNVSDTGMLIETRLQLDCGEPVCVELRGQRELRGTIVWTRSGRAGVRFAERIAVETLVALSPPASRLRKARVPRGPRLQVDCAVEVQLGSSRFDALLKDISQGGAKLIMPLQPHRDERLLLMVPGLPMKLGIVCWSDGEVGVAFAEPLSFDLLAEWLLVREGAEPWPASD